MITRRCTQRQFLTRPDRETNNAFIYYLAVAKFGIRVLFNVAMTNPSGRAKDSKMTSDIGPSPRKKCLSRDAMGGRL